MPSSDVLTRPEAPRLNHPEIDRTHQEFVELLADAQAAWNDDPGAGAMDRFEGLIVHTVAHFGQEDRWLQATGFSADNCHTQQHEMVLRVMREALRLAREGIDCQPLAVLLGELAIWFPQHVEMMDAGLAAHLAAVGFDVATGRMAAPLPETPLTHCGGGGSGGSCG